MATFLFNFWLKSSAVFACLILGVIGAFLFEGAFEFLKSGPLPEIFTSSLWYPSENSFGILGMLSGSLSVVLLTILVSAPISMLSALSLIFYLPKQISKVLEFIIELAAGIPSVVIGLFGILVLVPFLGNYFPPGHGLFAAIVVLSLVLVPSLVLQMKVILIEDLSDLRMIAKSLGLRDATLISRILWPSKKSELYKSLGIHMGRGFGETLAILMVAGNVIRVPDGFFVPFRTINAGIALEVPYAQKMHLSSLFFLGILTLVLVVLSRLLFGPRIIKRSIR